MRIWIVALALVTAGCTAQSETGRMAGLMAANCRGLGGAAQFETRDKVVVKFTCQLALPAAWVEGQ